MDDLTGTPPFAHMSVARGRLTGFPSNATCDVGVCQAAAQLAIKQADRILPDAHPFHPSHIDVDLQADGDDLVCTVTIQGYARKDIDNQAMLGVCVALLAARDAMGVESAKLVDVALVQNVK